MARFSERTDDSAGASYNDPNLFTNSAGCDEARRRRIVRFKSRLCKHLERKRRSTKDSWHGECFTPSRPDLERRSGGRDARTAGESFAPTIRAEPPSARHSEGLQEVTPSSRPRALPNRAGPGADRRFSHPSPARPNSTTPSPEPPDPGRLSSFPPEPLARRLLAL